MNAKEHKEEVEGTRQQGNPEREKEKILLSEETRPYSLFLVSCHHSEWNGNRIELEMP